MNTKDFRQFGGLLAITAAVLIWAAPSAWAQSEADPSYLPLDDRLELMMGQAADFVSNGQNKKAGEMYARIEAYLDNQVSTGKPIQFLSIGPDLYRNAWDIVRERIGELQEEGLVRYREIRDPKARSAIKIAISRGNVEGMITAARRFRHTRPVDRFWESWWPDSLSGESSTKL